jgi:ribose 5-phosphate isomerase B
MKIALGYDHTSALLKDVVLAHLENYDVTDFGSSPEYPAGALAVAKSVAATEHDLGILLCGTGVGMCIAANKVRGARAVVCSEPYSARLSRQHNNAQILCLGARVIGTELAKLIIDEFLSAQFEGGRHATRVDTFMEYENITH